MSVYNTTYNIKQPSFGQALLGGFMQSLGMGGGCCGFGGGMNSIWSMGGFGMPGGYGCGGYTDYNTSAGYAVANALMGVVGQAVNCYWGGGGGSTSSADLTPEEIDKEIDKLETKSESTQNSIKKKYDSAIDKAYKSLEDIGSKIGTLNDEIADLTASLEDEKNKPDGEKNATEINKLEWQIKSKQEEIERLKKEKAKLEGTEADKGSIEYLKKQREDALKEKQEEYDEKIEELENKKEKLETKDKEDKLNKADGHKWQQLKQTDYDKLFKEDGITLEDDVKPSEKAARRAIQLYRNASGEDKEKYRKQFLEIYENLKPEEKAKFKEAHNILKK